MLMSRFQQNMRWAAMGLFFLWGALLPAYTDVSITNPGFESPPLTSGDSWYSGVDGWAVTGAIGTTYDNPWNGPHPAPEGSQYVYADVNSFSISQEVGTLAAGKRYVLDVQVFALEESTSNSLEVVIDLWNGSWWEPAEQRVFRPVWETRLLDMNLGAEIWSDVQVVLKSDEFPSYIGSDMRIRIGGYKLAVDNVRLRKYDNSENPPVSGKTYYVSSSGGDDTADGLSPENAWAGFENLNAKVLLPGDKVCLKRGDQWTEELHLRGQGFSGAEIELTAYGSPGLPRPRIVRSDLEYDRAIVIERASYWKINEMDCRHAKLGLYLRYHDSYFNKSVTITDCYFEGNTDTSLEPANHYYELAFSDAIWMGGHVWRDNAANVLDGLTITDCRFKDCAHGFGTAWYYPGAYKGRLTNFYMADCVAEDCQHGAFSVMDASNSLIERVDSIGGGEDQWCGSTLGFLQACTNVTVQNCLFAYCNRQESGDGVGFDFEGNCDNCTFSNNVITGCSGAAILILSTDGNNLNITVEDNIFYNNCQNPWNSHINSEVLCGNSGNTGSVINNIIYRVDDSANFYSPDFDNFTISGNVTANFDPTDEIRWWDFDNDGDLEGWNTFNDWNNPEVTGGVLTGSDSTGLDPFAHTPTTWIPAHLYPYCWIRMAHTEGDWAQVFYVTATDSAWDGAKSFFFPVTADGQMHDYFIDMRQEGVHGVITQMRLDPPFGATGTLEIDCFRLTNSLDPNQTAPAAPLPIPSEMTFYSDAGQDGYVLESGEGSGVGWINNSGDATMRMGDESDNSRYRCIVSFDTSGLPDDGVISSATLAFTRISKVNDDPWTFGGHLSETDLVRADIASPYFGSSVNLEGSDFQAPADAADVANYIVPFQDGLTVMDLVNETGLNHISLTGTTQFRLGGQPGTDGDNGADYVNLGSGSNGTTSYRPWLRVKYYLDTLPAGPPQPAAPTVWHNPVTPPPLPSSISATVLSDSAITWNWTDMALHETGFAVYWAEGNTPPGTITASLDPDSESYPTASLSPNRETVFQIQSLGAFTDSAKSSTFSAWTLAVTPAAPVLSNPAPEQMDLTPGTDANPTGTAIAIYCDTTGQWVKSDGTFSASADWFALSNALTITGLTPDTLYAFQIKARNGAGVETVLGPPASEYTTTAPAAPTAPDNLQATVLGPDSIRWTWNDASDIEEGFRLYQALEDSRPATLVMTLGANSTLWESVTLQPNQTYAFLVSAYNGIGETEATSHITAVTEARTPGPLQVISVGGQSLSLQLDAQGNPADTEYALYCDTTDQWLQRNSSLGGTEIWQTLESPFTISGLDALTTYQFRIKARNGEMVETGFSETLELRTDVPGPAAGHNWNAYQ